MSQVNVELVRHAFGAFERDGLAGMLPHFDCEIEWTTTDSYIAPATYRGYEGVLRYLGTMVREFDGIHLEAQELIGAGDQVVVTWRIHGRGKSGAPVDSWKLPGPTHVDDASAAGWIEPTGGQE
jgi:ketosteroid isomerase-like protein